MHNSQKITAVTALVLVLMAWAREGDCQDWKPVAGDAPAEQAGKLTASCSRHDYGPWSEAAATIVGESVSFLGADEGLGDDIPRYWMICGVRHDVQENEQVLTIPAGSTPGKYFAVYNVAIGARVYAKRCEFTVLAVYSDPSVLWYLGGETSEDYPTSSTWTVAGASEGTYTWEITEGESMVRFPDNQTTLTTDEPTVTLISKLYSETEGDITVELRYSSEKCPSTLIDEWPITVLAPISVPEVRTNGLALPYAWGTTYRLRIFERLGIRSMDAPLPLNEEFGTWSPLVPPWGTPNPWSQMAEPRGNGTLGYTDVYYAPWLLPLPLSPDSTGPDNWLVQEVTQWHRAGSLVSGRGLTIHKHTLQYWRAGAWWVF